MSGDLAAHYLSRWGSEYVFSAVQQATELIKNAYSNIPMIPVLGNNDLAPHYTTICYDPWNQRIKVSNYHA